MINEDAEEDHEVEEEHALAGSSSARAASAEHVLSWRGLGWRRLYYFCWQVWANRTLTAFSTTTVKKGRRERCSVSKCGRVVLVVATAPTSDET